MLLRQIRKGGICRVPRKGQKMRTDREAQGVRAFPDRMRESRAGTENAERPGSAREGTAWVQDEKGAETVRRNGLQKGLTIGLAGLLLMGAFAGCGKVAEPVYVGQSLVSGREVQTLDSGDKYRTYYEIFVGSFYDGNGDGQGDLKGVTQMLDYLNDGDNTTDTDLGITGIWLMPIMPSDTYHKYDVMDYTSIDPTYGTMQDFDELIAACNERGINVIIDLVMNHTSSSHPWFKTATAYLKKIGDAEPDPQECPYVEYYNFTKTPLIGYANVSGTDWYYECPFWSEMPDLNLYNEAVRAEFEEICRFWLDRGVAGFRLDAVKEYVSDNTEKNVEILTWFNGMVKSIAPDAYLVGEAWTSQPEYAKYYASGIDSFFDFAFADQTGNIVKFATGVYPAQDLGGYISRGEERFAEQGSQYINAPFYSNHDMDRAAGYYSGDYAEEQVKIAGALNMTMTGNVFLYYGDEIGMQGSGKDENKRLAMRWTADEAAEGMCKSPAAADTGIVQNYPAEDEQAADTASLLTWYKNLIRLRNQFPSIRRGSTKQLDALSDKEVCALLKTDGEERVVLLYNLSAEERKVSLEGVTLEDGTSLTGKMLEATLVSGETPVAAEGGEITLPAYSLAVLLVSE